MVNEVYISKFVSREKGTEYCCLVFDLGYCKQKVFADRTALLAISGVTVEKFSSLKVNDILPIPFKK